jgi:hypothetical protein
VIKIRICIEPLTDVNLFIASEPTYLGTVKAGPDGYAERTFELPSHIRSGQHTVIAVGEGLGEGRAELRQPVDLSAAAPVATGTSIAMLMVWAVVLVIVASWLLRMASRGAINLSPIRLMTTRLRGSPARSEPPASEPFPYLDTSDFVNRPHRTGPGSGKGEITEADADF